MCCQKPYLCLIPITAVYSAILVVIYAVFYIVFGPLSINQESGYALFIVSKCIMVIALCAAMVVILQDIPDLGVGGIVVILLVLGCSLGTMSSFRLLEPTKDEMVEYLDEHYNNPGPYLFKRAPIFLLYVQSINKCCGINGYEDYNRVEKDEKFVSVPESCCRVQWDGCGKNLLLGSPAATKNRIYVQGCVPQSLMDIGQDQYSIYKVANTVPITTVIMDILSLLIFIYHFHDIRRAEYTPDPATLVSYPSGTVISWIDPSAMPEGPVKDPQPLPLVRKNPYRHVTPGYQRPGR